jgi:quinol-cytochrome oxidoreductase complex cytochrome b subunit
VPGTEQPVKEQDIREQKKFYPEYLSEVLVVMLLCFEALIILALLFPTHLGRPVDLTRQFQPRPEWYFLWLFQLVGYFPGKSAVIGTVVIPLVCVLLLLFLPFLDRGPRGRIKAGAVATILLLLFALLTLQSVW